jgi:hypothetical protein
MTLQETVDIFKNKGACTTDKCYTCTLIKKINLVEHDVCICTALEEIERAMKDIESTTRPALTDYETRLRDSVAVAYLHDTQMYDEQIKSAFDRADVFMEARKNDRTNH